MAALLTILTEALLRAFHQGELTPEQSEEVAEAIKEDEEAQAFLDRLKGSEPGSTETTGNESGKGQGTNGPDAAEKKRNIMTPDLDEKLDNRAEMVRGELEKLRGEARKLQAEARLAADQHLNKIEDQIEELRRGRKGQTLSEAGEAISAGASRAWSEISEAMREVGRIIKREMDQERADRR